MTPSKNRLGVLYVAYGEAARREAAASAKSLPSGLPVCVVGDEPLLGNALHHIPFPDPGPGARRAKLNAVNLSPFTHTLYLDADTRPVGDVALGFTPLLSGWHLCMAHSARQGHDVLGNCTASDRHLTLQEIANAEPLALQAGVIFFRRCDEVSQFYDAWLAEWERDRTQDQGAFLRALNRNPLRIWLLGLPWNSEYGEVIQHKFGRVRI